MLLDVSTSSFQCCSPALPTLSSEEAHWGAKVDEIVANLDVADAQADIDYHRKVENLKAKYHAAVQMHRELKAADKEKWEQFKTSLENTWNEFEVALKEFLA